MSPRRYNEVAAFILAGGQSSRMGRDKAWLELAGVPLVVRIAHAVEPLVSTVTVVGPPERFKSAGLTAIPDRISKSDTSAELRLGPLGAIVTALNASECRWNLMLACDLPYLSTQWLDWLLQQATASPAQVVMPERIGGVEPLAAVYRKECAAVLSAALAREVRKVSDALSGLRVTVIAETEWRPLDPDGRVLANMNTPEEYAQARKWWEEVEGRG